MRAAAATLLALLVLTRWLGTALAATWWRIGPRLFLARWAAEGAFARWPRGEPLTGASLAEGWTSGRAIAPWSSRRGAASFADVSPILRHVDAHGTPFEKGSIELFDRGLGSFFGRVLDEAESA